MKCFFLLFFIEGCLCNTPFTIQPLSLVGWKGSCVVIPCQMRNTFGGLHIHNISLIWYFGAKFDKRIKDYTGTMLYNSSNDMTQAIPDLHKRATFIGNLNEKNCSLKISQLQEEDSGYYGARLYGIIDYKADIQKWFQETYVNILEAPPVPKMELSPEKIKENCETTVRCSVSYHCPSEPVKMILSGLEDLHTSNIKSTEENRELSHELTFSPTWMDNGKQLTCLLKSHNEDTISENTIQLDVEYAPKGINLTADPGTTIREGGKLTLSCMVRSSNPHVSDYKWWKNSHNTYEGIVWDKVKINNVQQEHSGLYKCGAVNKFGTTESEELTIDVQYPPTETKVLFSSQTIKEHDAVTLTCSSRANPSISRYTWYKYPALNATISKKELRFEAIQPSDSGTYYCVAYNPIGNSCSSDVTVDVLYGPKDVQLTILNHLPIKEGVNIAFNCSVGSANPKINQYKLLENNTVLRKDISSNLITSVAKPAQATAYKCEVCNSIGCTSSPAISVNVQFSPKKVKVVLETKGKIKEGDFVKLSCQVGTANPDEIEYRWYKDHQHLNAEGTQLIILKATSEDSGDYYCEAQNNVGTSISSHLTLDVRYGPRSVSVSLDSKESIIEGNDVLLQCESDAHPPANSYKWYRNGEEIFQKSSQTLALPKVQVSQSANYFCIVSNEISKNTSQPLTLVVSYSRATVMKSTLISLGCVLALVVLVALLVYSLRRWKKTIDPDTGRTQRSGSFFVKKANGRELHNNNNRLNNGRREVSFGFHNQSAEDTVTYTTVRVPPTLSDESVIYTRIKEQRQTADSSDENMIYGVVNKSGILPKEDVKPDYENIKETNEELHYSSLVNLAPRTHPTYLDSETDSDSEYSINYAVLKH